MRPRSALCIEKACKVPTRWFQTRQNLDWQFHEGRDERSGENCFENTTWDTWNIFAVVADVCGVRLQPYPGSGGRGDAGATGDVVQRDCSGCASISGRDWEKRRVRIGYRHAPGRWTNHRAPFPGWREPEEGANPVCHRPPSI